MANCQNYADFCRLVNARDETALLLLRMQHNFMRASEMDPLTGACLPQDLETYLQKIASCSPENASDDRLSHIIRHCESALRQILETPTEKLVREHALLPLQAVREADSVTLSWLNSKPGRTIRQKIGASRSLLAPRRRWSMDTSENRLLKKFLLTLVMLLETRALSEAARKELDYWRNISLRWLRQNEVMEIGPWQNTVPNNILLSHKHYRRIWNGWTWMRVLDRQIAEDFNRFPSLLLESLFWRSAAMLFQNHSYRLLQDTVISDFNRLVTDIAGQNSLKKLIRGRCQTKNGWRPLKVELDSAGFTLEVNNRPIISGIRKENGVIIRINDQDYPCLSEKDFFSLCPLSPAQEKLEDAGKGSICVIDFSCVQPLYSLDGKKPKKLPFRLLAQITENATRLVNLGNAKAFTLEKENPPVSFFDIFERELPDEWLNAAAQFFFERLKSYFRESDLKSLIAIIPDGLNEFQLSIFQKYLRVYFPSSRTLPASVAAAFSYENRKGLSMADEEHPLIIVFSIVGEKLILTPLEGEKDEGLAKRIPGHSGFVWSRHPSHEIPYPNGILKNILEKHGISLPFMPLSAENLKNMAGKVSLFPKENNEYLEPVDLPEQLAGYIEEQLSKAPESLDEFKKIIQAIAGKRKMVLYAINSAEIRLLSPGVRLEYSGLPVTGGSLYGQWKSAAPDSILWRDHLPDLYMRVSSLLKPIALARNLTIQPIPGKKIPVILPDEVRQISLPGDKAICQFPLQRDESGAKIRYIGQLESRKYLPVGHDWLAKLELTYEYGAENPFELAVIPLEKGMPKKLIVRWLPVSELCRESPAPPFIPENDWESLRSFEEKDGQVDAIQRLLDMFDAVHNLRVFLDESSKEPCRRVYFENFSQKVVWVKDQYSFLKPVGWPKEIFLHKNSFINNEKDACPLDADSISFDVVSGKKPGTFEAVNVSEGFSVRLPHLIESRSRFSVKRFEGKFRFYIQLIWKFGRSLADPDSPEELRQGVMRFVEDVKWLGTYENQEALPWKILAALERAIKLMHKDAPVYIWDTMEEQLEERKWSAWEIGYALGCLATERQREMFNNIVEAGKEGDGMAFAILGNALWRSRNLVHMLLPEQAHELAHGLLKFLRKSLKKLKSLQAPLEEKKFREMDTDFKNICETFLALLRARESDSSEIAALLNSNGELAEEFRTAFEALAVVQQEYGLPLKSHIKLELPDGNRKIPDILRAADLYLNGDSSASDIRIVGISEDED